MREEGGDPSSPGLEEGSCSPGWHGMQRPWASRSGSIVSSLTFTSRMGYTWVRMRLLKPQEPTWDGRPSQPGRDVAWPSPLTLHPLPCEQKRSFHMSGQCWLDSGGICLRWHGQCPPGLVIPGRDLAYSSHWGPSGEGDDRKEPRHLL
jgi:hypothetical protein